MPASSSDSHSIGAPSRLARFAWMTLAYNIAVILWGAYVRASGSGAGCGSHWPLCNGEILPRAPSVATLIEFSHRITSGLALLAVVALLVWTWRTCAAGHPARRGATLSLLFMLTEAGVGAGLVLFELVADNASMARAMFMAVHLANTFLLLAALTLTAWWLSGGEDIEIAGRGGLAAGLGALAAGIILVSVSGAVAALGDTLYPSQSLSHAIAADLSPSSHALIRLRVLHPTLAIAIGGLLMIVAPRLPGPGRLVRYPRSGTARETGADYASNDNGDDDAESDGGERFFNTSARRERDTVADENFDPTSLAAMASMRLRPVIIGLVLLQFGVGFANVILLAPTAMQIIHLLLADAVWIAFVLLAAATLARQPHSARSAVSGSTRVARHAGI